MKKTRRKISHKIEEKIGGRFKTNKNNDLVKKSGRQKEFCISFLLTKNKIKESR